MKKLFTNRDYQDAKELKLYSIENQLYLSER